MIVKQVMAGEAATEAVEMRYLRLCLASRWDPSALAEAAAICADAGFDWAAVRQWARDEGVAPLWYSRVRDRNVVPAAIEGELQAAYRESALRNMTLFGERDRVLRELSDVGIDVIVLKGAALAESVYGDIALRSMSDLDLLVRPEDVNAVVQCLARAGYDTPVCVRPETGGALEYENEVAVSKPADARYRVDVHWSLFASPYYRHRVPGGWFWATALPLAAATPVPGRMLGPEAQVLHLAAHLMLQHGGQSLKWWQDVAEVVRVFRQQIDWDLLLERARTYDLVLPLQRVLLELAEQWRLPIPGGALQKLRAMQPSVHERLMHARLAARHRPSILRYWDDVCGMPNWRGRLHYAGRKLFPSVQYMRWRYALRQAWLLPLAYPYRWFRGMRVGKKQ